MDRLYAYGLTLALTAAVVWPAFRTPYTDGYPFSNFPMFSRLRPRQAWVNVAVGIDGQGRRVPLGPELIANQEAMQAVATLRRTFSRGAAASEALCRRIARRVADSPGLDGVTEVRLLSEQLDAVGYFSGDREASATIDRARCPVPAERGS